MSLELKSKSELKSDCTQLFNSVIEYGKITKSNKNTSTSTDGLTNWNNIKKYMNDSKLCNWTINIVFNDGKKSSDIQQIYDYVHDNLHMKGDDLDPKSNMESWEPAHFILQLIRIPKNNQCSIQRLLQVAFNIGQYYAVLDNPIYNSIYTPDVIQYFTDNKLSDINSYINLDQCITSIDSSLLQKIIDGVNSELDQLQFKSKYLKYKSKYLAIKK